MINFTIFPLWINLILFVAIALAVWSAGSRLSVYADIISDRTNTSKVLMGFVFLAVVTQLPEIVTNSTAALQGNSALVLNSMFGGVVMQTAVLFIADISVVSQTLTYYAYRSASHLQGIMLILALALLLAIIQMDDMEIAWKVGTGTLMMSLFYLLTLLLLWRYEKNNQWEAINIPEEKKKEATHKLLSKHQSISTKALLLRSLGAALIILLCGVLLVQFAEAIAVQTGLGSSFIGATLLATSTSLPELSTAITAVKLGAASMAIADIFGSNLIMLLLLFPSDLLYRKGLLLNEAGPSAQFLLLSGIIVTAIYLVGLQLRSTKRVLGAGVDSWMVLFGYLATLLVLFNLK